MKSVDDDPDPRRRGGGRGLSWCTSVPRAAAVAAEASVGALTPSLAENHGGASTPPVDRTRRRCPVSAARSRIRSASRRSCEPRFPRLLSLGSRPTWHLWPLPQGALEQSSHAYGLSCGNLESAAAPVGSRRPAIREEPLSRTGRPPSPITIACRLSRSLSLLFVHTSVDRGKKIRWR
jgi:hypothetical protein